MFRAIADNIKGLFSLLTGLAVTGRYALGPFPGWLGLKKSGHPQLTTHYPRQTICDENLVSFRGPVELVPDEKNRNLCVSCQLCARACPSDCLTVVKGPEKAPVKFLSDFSLCSLCGTCVEVCPAGALRYSHDIYWVTENREDLTQDLLAKLASKKERVAA